MHHSQADLVGNGLVRLVEFVAETGWSWLGLMDQARTSRSAALQDLAAAILTLSPVSFGRALRVPPLPAAAILTHSPVSPSPAPLIPHRRRTPSVLNHSHPFSQRRKATSTRDVSPDLVRRRLLRVIAVLPSRSSRSVAAGGRSAFHGTGSVTFSCFRPPCNGIFGMFPSFSIPFCQTLSDPLC